MTAGSGFRRKEGRDKMGGKAGSDNPIVHPLVAKGIKYTYRNRACVEFKSESVAFTLYHPHIVVLFSLHSLW